MFDLWKAYFDFVADCLESLAGDDRRERGVVVQMSEFRRRRK